MRKLDLGLGILVGFFVATMGCSGPVKPSGSGGSDGGAGAGGPDLAAARDGAVVSDGAAALDNRVPDSPVSNDGPPASAEVGVGDLASEASGPITASACTSMFCEDFEKATLDTAAWSTNDGNKGVIVQTVKFAHGQRAVKLHVDPNSRRAYIVTKNAPAGLRSHLFGRAYYYMAATQVQGHGPSIWAGRANGPFTSVELIGGAGGAALLGIGGSGDRGGTDGGKILFDRWMCIEWEFNDQPGQATLWFDGKKMGMTPPFSSNGGLVEMAFGINLYAGTVNGPTDLYLDDIALDTQRIGCM